MPEGGIYRGLRNH